MNTRFFNRPSVICTLLALSIFTVSCIKPVEAPDNSSLPDVPLVTDAGIPDGTPVSVTIGAAGGSITSPNGKLKITIPAGAVNANKVFTIQPITNTNETGKGKAYRITPHGEQFAKPVQLSFSYGEEDIQNTIPEALAIAYQDGGGAWMAIGSTVDTVNKTVTVSTNHFSDWSLFNVFEMFPEFAVVNLNESVRLDVISTLDELEVPVPGETKPVLKKKSITEQYIRQWTFNGVGKLVREDAAAIYTAPSQMPAVNPVAVRAELKTPTLKQYSLVCNVYIGSDGITFRINNGSWVHSPVPTGVLNASGTTVLQGGAVINGVPAGTIDMKWMSNSITYHNINWGDAIPWFVYAPGGNVSYQHFFANPGIVVSPGGIQFLKYGKNPGEYIVGTFYLDRAAKKTVTPTGVTWQPVIIDGYFKVKRAN